MQKDALSMDLRKCNEDLKASSSSASIEKVHGQDREQKLLALEKSLREANSIISAYENQTVRLSNQIKLLEVELETMNRKAAERYGHPYADKPKNTQKAQRTTSSTARSPSSTPSSSSTRIIKHSGRKPGSNMNKSSPHSMPKSQSLNLNSSDSLPSLPKLTSSS
jgi:peptidoglycan hydrolase CwlO-like protein